MAAHGPRREGLLSGLWRGPAAQEAVGVCPQERGGGFPGRRFVLRRVYRVELRWMFGGRLMRTVFACWLCGVLAAWSAGCSSGGGGQDAGGDAVDGFGEQDGQGDLDAGGDELGDGDGDGGGEGEGNWSWCPLADDYVGGDWPWSVQVTGEALYCGTFDEARTLEEEARVKCRMRLVEGVYPLPDQNGTYPFRLPVCLEFVEEGSQPETAAAGSITANHTSGPEGFDFRFQWEQPLETAGGGRWVLVATWSGRMAPGESSFVLDGSHAPDGGELYVDFRLCKGDCSAWEDVRWFDSCRFENVRTERHTVAFEGGRVQLDFRMGFSMASTEPGIFWQAAGELDGTGFEQRDYYRLVYNPEHHHFSRDFVVLFDDLIEGACGLKLEHLDPWGDPPPGRVTTVDCDLGEIGERPVESENWEILE